MREKIATGEIKTPHLQDGDMVEIEMLDADSVSLFGRIAQVVRVG